MGGETMKKTYLVFFFSFLHSPKRCSCQSLSYLWYIKNILAWITNVLFHCRSLRTASLRSAITKPPPNRQFLKWLQAVAFYLSHSCVYLHRDTRQAGFWWKTVGDGGVLWMTSFFSPHCSKQNDHRITVIEWGGNLIYASKWWGARKKRCGRH